MRANTILSRKTVWQMPWTSVPKNDRFPFTVFVGMWGSLSTADAVNDGWMKWMAFWWQFQMHFLKRNFCILNQTPLNSLWPSDTIWQQRSGSTLAQIMACCLTASGHYLNQCWLFNTFQWIFYQNSIFFRKEIHLNISFTNSQLFCSDLSVLIVAQWHHLEP